MISLLICYVGFEIRNEYNIGVLQLENALKVAHQSPTHQNSVKQQIAKAKQMLLNAQEKRFNLTERFYYP